MDSSTWVEVGLSKPIRRPNQPEENDQIQFDAG